MPNSVQAAAEGLPKINRRRALTLTGTGIAAALTAISATTIPSDALPTPQVEVDAFADHPWTRATALAKQLADVLNEGDSAFSGPGGGWYAEVHPSEHSDYPVAFGNISAREWRRHNVTLQFSELIDAHKKAREALNDAVDGTDCPSPTKAAERRWRRADRAETAALIAICAYAPYGQADATVKARYLSRYCRSGELLEEHIAALINSGVRS